MGECVREKDKIESSLAVICLHSISGPFFFSHTYKSFIPWYIHHFRTCLPHWRKENETKTEPDKKVRKTPASGTTRDAAKTWLPSQRRSTHTSRRDTLPKKSPKKKSRTRSPRAIPHIVEKVKFCTPPSSSFHAFAMGSHGLSHSGTYSPRCAVHHSKL